MLAGVTGVKGVTTMLVCEAEMSPGSDMSGEMVIPPMEEVKPRLTSERWRECVATLDVLGELTREPESSPDPVIGVMPNADAPRANEPGRERRTPG